MGFSLGCADRNGEIDLLFGDNDLPTSWVIRVSESLFRITVWRQARVRPGLPVRRGRVRQLERR